VQPATDDSGTIKPGAKAVGAQAAIALPVLDDGGEVRALSALRGSREGAWAGARAVDDATGGGRCRRSER